MYDNIFMILRKNFILDCRATQAYHDHVMMTNFISNIFATRKIKRATQAYHDHVMMTNFISNIFATRKIKINEKDANLLRELACYFILQKLLFENKYIIAVDLNIYIICE